MGFNVAQNIWSSAEIKKKFGMRWRWENDDKILFEVGNQGYIKYIRI